MKPVVTTVTVLLVNLAFQTSIAALSYVTVMLGYTLGISSLSYIVYPLLFA